MIDMQSDLNHLLESFVTNDVIAEMGNEMLRFTNLSRFRLVKIADAI